MSPRSREAKEGRKNRVPPSKTTLNVYLQMPWAHSCRHFSGNEGAYENCEEDVVGKLRTRKSTRKNGPQIYECFDCMTMACISFTPRRFPATAESASAAFLQSFLDRFFAANSQFAEFMSPLNG